jgi:hypothetical protein
VCSKSGSPRGSDVQSIKSDGSIRGRVRVASSIRILPAVAAVALVLMLWAPSVEAFLVPKYDFSAEIPALSVSSNKTRGGPGAQINFTMLTGAYRGGGTIAGAFTLVDAVAGGSVTNTERIDVINTQDKEGAIARFSQGKCQTVSQCGVERSFAAGTMTLDDNSTLIFYSEKTPLHHNITTPFGIGVFVNASQALRNSQLGNVSLTHSLLVVGEAVTITGKLASATDSFYAVLANPNVTVTVGDAQGSQTYKGQQYLFRFHGTPTFSMQGTGVGAPFVNGTVGVFKRADAADLEAGFRPEHLNTAVRALGGRDILLPSLSKGLRDLGPILNGVLLGRAADPIVNGEEANATDLAIVRFSKGILVPLNTSAMLSAQTEFILLGNQGFYTDQDSLNLGFMRVPPLSLLIWTIAAIAIVLGFVLRPMLASAQPGAFGGIRILGWIFHGLALAIAFILWDQEIKNFLGTSFLTVWTDSAFGKGVVLTITAVLELLSFMIAGLLFGMPIRFIVNSGLKLGGLKKARGVGKGIGNLATWGLGAPFIPFVLNGFVSGIIDALQKSLGGG